MTTIVDQNQFLRSLFERAVSVADPMQVIPQKLPERPPGRVVVIGAGKASARMAEAVENVWGPCEGLVLTRYGYARPTKKIEIVEAAHPVPDKIGMETTSRILDLVEGLDEDCFVLALMSGGGSSLLCAPVDGLGLADKQAVNTALLQSGARIGEMNVVRKHLSKVKAGRLAKTIYPARCLSLMISDVSGDDPGEIASGATVGEPTSPQDALAIIQCHGMTLPDAALDVLSRPNSVVHPNDPSLKTTDNIIIAAPMRSLEAAKELAETRGVNVHILADDLEGEAQDQARAHVQEARETQSRMKPGDKPVLLLSGGECTVSNWGGGVGGPNAEFALAAAVELGCQTGIYLLACDTDGVDGAAEIAGAIVGPDTLAKASHLGVDPAHFLKMSGSHDFFAAIDEQVITGPTLTNVNDFRAILIEPLEK